MLHKIKMLLVSTSATLALLMPALLAPAMVRAAECTGAADVTPNQTQSCLCSGANVDLSGASSNNCSDTTASDSATKLVKTIINVISVIVGVIAVIMIIIGGFRYIASGGKQESVQAAKNTILYAIIGLVIVALAQIVVRFILNKTTSATAP